MFKFRQISDVNRDGSEENSLVCLFFFFFLPLYYNISVFSLVSPECKCEIHVWLVIRDTKE